MSRPDVRAGVAALEFGGFAESEAFALHEGTIQGQPLDADTTARGARDAVLHRRRIVNAADWLTAAVVVAWVAVRMAARGWR